MKLATLLVLLSGCASAETRLHKVYNWSQAAFVAGATADLVTSRGLVEGNPVLGRGPFGARQAGIKIGITGGALVAQYFVTRRHPERERFYTWANFVAAGAWAGVAAHNQSLK